MTKEEKLARKQQRKAEETGWPLRQYNMECVERPQILQIIHIRTMYLTVKLACRTRLTRHHAAGQSRLVKPRLPAAERLTVLFMAPKLR